MALRWVQEPGKALAAKLCAHLRPKCHALLLDASISSALTVRRNVHQMVLLAAMKLHCQVSGLLSSCMSLCVPAVSGLSNIETLPSCCIVDFKGLLTCFYASKWALQAQILLHICKCKLNLHRKWADGGIGACRWWRCQASSRAGRRPSRPPYSMAWRTSVALSCGAQEPAALGTRSPALSKPYQRR